MLFKVSKRCEEVLNSAVKWFRKCWESADKESFMN